MEMSTTEMQKLVPCTAFPAMSELKPATSELKPQLQNRGSENKETRNSVIYSDLKKNKNKSPKFLTVGEK